MNDLLEMTPMHYHERREGERFQRPVALKCRVNKGTFQPTEALDISVSGLRMQANRNYTVGSQVTVHLKPSPTKLMSLQAEVVWTSPSSGNNFQVGLHFTDGPSCDFAWLRKWLLGSEEASSSPRQSFRPAPLPLLSDIPEAPLPQRPLVGDAPPLFSSSAPLLQEPSQMDVFNWGGDAPTSSSGAHRCSCGAEFPLRVQLALHCQNERHEVAPLCTEAPAPAPKVRRQIPWGKVVIVGLLMASTCVSLGTLRFYSNWLPSINFTAALPNP